MKTGALQYWGLLNRKGMIMINKKDSFPVNEVLFTFALASEAADVFTGCRHLICGIGKVSAAYEVLKPHKKDVMVL